MADELAPPKFLALAWHVRSSDSSVLCESSAEWRIEFTDTTVKRHHKTNEIRRAKEFVAEKALLYRVRCDYTCMDGQL